MVLISWYKLNKDIYIPIDESFIKIYDYRNLKYLKIKQKILCDYNT